MALAKSSGKDFEKRDFVNQRDLLNEEFYIEKIGKTFTSKGPYPKPTVPVDVTLSSGEKRTWFATGAALVPILEDSVAPFPAILRKRADKDGRQGAYYLDEA